MKRWRINRKLLSLLLLYREGKYMEQRIYPIGIQNFESLRNDGYVYVDKTAWVYRLVNTGRYYFLSRPRRFGKSLLISTLEAYFLGKRELFKGLAIEQLEQNWSVRPVFHLDLNIGKYDTPESLDRILDDNLSGWEQVYGTRPTETTPALRFKGVIQRAVEKTGHRVAILVDEYDKPMLQAIGNSELQKQFRNTLKSFYGVLKTMDGYIKLGFLTGVTKFGKVSAFSDLNNLKDISMRRDYAPICGITDEELHQYFDEDLHELAEAQGMDYETVCAEMKKRYDGYHFNINTPGIYNPFSLLNTFDSMAFGNYWFATGTPSYLVYLLKKHNYRLEDIQGVEVTEAVLDSIDSEGTHPIPVIYQSGYLTIKDYDSRFKLYTLDYPNQEVEEGFLNYLMPFYTDKSESEAPFEIRKFVSEVENANVDSFFRRLQSFFADAPYEVIVGQEPQRNVELFFQNVLFIVFKMMGFYVRVEYHTNRGRVDLVLTTDKYIYLMEFKQDGTAEEALAQINGNHYGQPFQSDSRKLFKIGVNFSSKTRNIEEWEISVGAD